MPQTFGKNPDAWTHALPPNPYKPGSQNFRLYGFLVQHKKVLNYEIQQGLGGPKILKHTNRISECRSYLKSHGLDISCIPTDDTGVREYRVEGVM